LVFIILVTSFRRGIVGGVLAFVRSRLARRTEP
jgi:hypothetical protein